MLDDKLSRANRKIRKKQAVYMKLFLRESKIPIVVGQPESLNEKEGYYHAKYLRLLGFAVNQNREGFFNCTFPKGWRKKQMYGKDDWCYLVDNRKRNRAAINYKILSRIKDKILFTAFINYMPRFRAMVDHTITYDLNKKNSIEHYNSPMVGRILNSGNIIFETQPVIMEYKYGEDYYQQEEREIRSFLQAKCQEILEDNMADADNIFMYWNDGDDEKYNVQDFIIKLRGMNIVVPKPKVSTSQST